MTTRGVSHVQVRSAPTSNDWRAAPWLAPESIESTNAHYFGWQKYRLAPTESEQMNAEEGQ